MPRSGLTPEVIVQAAGELVDESGFGALSLAAVAKRFGVAAPSLYKHIGGLDDLQRMLAARVARELAAELRIAATGVSGPEAFARVADAYRRYAMAHPGQYAGSQRARSPGTSAASTATAGTPTAEAAPAGTATAGTSSSPSTELLAAADDLLEVLYRVLAAYGLHGDDAVDAARYVRSTLHGFVSLEAVGGFGMPQSVDRSFARLVTATDHALAGWVASA